jgi:hypothetical protein
VLLTIQVYAWISDINRINREPCDEDFSVPFWQQKSPAGARPFHQSDAPCEIIFNRLLLCGNISCDSSIANRLL